MGYDNGVFAFVVPRCNVRYSICDYRSYNNRKFVAFSIILFAILVGLPENLANKNVWFGTCSGGVARITNSKGGHQKGHYMDRTYNEACYVRLT